ncbi:MAG TPA: glutamate--cysteine ligase [Bacillota bacterium]|nr:glutamate--cysteine ligase [Bacillota bacterium]
MDWNYQNLYEFFLQGGRSSLLRDGKWGLEKESQRITPRGELALTDHPAVFGNQTENPFITKDFSESQLELITPPFTEIKDTHAFLVKLQATVMAGIGTELLWPLSMPPRLPDDSRIPIAKFPDSDENREQEIYRQGLALRYGKKIQMISGIHYNFSLGSELLEVLYRSFSRGQELQEFINDRYFALTRNFLRYRWLLIYLFGASPSIDATYYSVIRQELQMIEACCPEYCSLIEQYQQYATSLRVSRFGYANPEQGKNNAFFNNLAAYIHNIRNLLSTKSHTYADLGICQDGVRVQLNEHILQKESEFYAPIRLKQTTRRGETQLEALADRGVQYVEVRTLDLNPFEPVGIGLQQLYFLQVFMLFCLFETSPLIPDEEGDLINKNHHAVALFGRNEHLQLRRYGAGQIRLTKWGEDIFHKLQRIAELLDRGRQNPVYQESVKNEALKLVDLTLLPSTRIEMEMKQRQESLLDFGVRYAGQYKVMERMMHDGNVHRV